MSQKKGTEEGQARCHPDAKATVKMSAFILKPTAGAWRTQGREQWGLILLREDWLEDRLD